MRVSKSRVVGRRGRLGALKAEWADGQGEMCVQSWTLGYPCLTG